MSNKTSFKIIRDEGGMAVYPDHPEARKFLTLKHKEMVKEKGRTFTKWHQSPMWSSITSGEGIPGLMAYQGFWKKLSDNLRLKGHEVTVVDGRTPGRLPTPNMSAAMSGLREWQKPWILKALISGDSGLLGAPTRYGKSYGMTAIAKAFEGAKIVVTAPGVDLCEQLLEHFREVLPNREVKGVFTGSRNSVQSEDITVCSVDSLDKMDAEDTDLLIIDEPHAVVSDERLPRIARFIHARKYGFGATLDGRFDQKDRLIEGLIGPVISNVTYLEAVDQGAISPLKVLMIEIPFSKDTIPGERVQRSVVYKRLLTESSRMAALIKKIVDDVIPHDWQTMSFIQNEKQALFYMDKAMPPEGTIAMAKRLKPKERRDVTSRIAAGEILRVLASNIYVQGITFPDLKVVINLAGGGANTTAIQKPGRLLQTRPNKNYGVMIDFVFKCRDKMMEHRQKPPYSQVVSECWARYNTYKKIGYDVVFVENAEQAKEIIEGAYDE